MIARRTLLLSAAALAGCAELPELTAAALVAPPDPPAAGALLTPLKRLDGGFLGRAAPSLGVPALPGTGMYTRFMSPVALAMRHSELLVADAGNGRLWRVDSMIGTMSGIAGVPVGPRTALALGPEGSAWVLDAVGRLIVRIARDGRPLQTLRAGVDLAAPVALALADNGTTLLVADGTSARWAEFRGGAGLPLLQNPRLNDPTAVKGVDGLAVHGDEVYVLDRLGGAVHRLRRDGGLIETLGRGELQQPAAIGVDRDGRVFVLDGHDQSLRVLRSGGPGQRFDSASLGLVRPSAMAVDGDRLAVADGTAGRVQLWRIAPQGASR